MGWRGVGWRVLVREVVFRRALLVPECIALSLLSLLSIICKEIQQFRTLRNILGS
jgi:hypothetical protein